jgi:choline dehydrogenase-like flavoprotein
MNPELNENQRAVLQALCDTFVPSIKVANDPIGFWARTASDLGVDCVLARNLKEDVPPKLYQGLVGLLDALGAKGFIKAPQAQREAILTQISGSSPQAGAGVAFYQKQTVLLTYGLPENPIPDRNMVTYGSPRGQNPNWEVLNYPGPVSVPPSKEKEIKTITLSGDSQTFDADVCIVGSGAGGAVIACKMAMQGRRVLVLEAGGHYNRADFHQLELWGYRHLWYKGGATPTADGNVLLLAGGSLGGGTEINWMNCVRTPDLVRQDWVQQYGLEGVDGQEFENYIDEVLDRIQANQHTAIWNSQNLRMSEGCHKLGYLSKRTFVNWDPKLFQPLMAGYTGFGDQTGGKQTARRTFLRDAYEHGAQIIVNCRADRILVEQGRTTGVAATYADPKGHSTQVIVRAPQVVAAAGSLETPALLLRSGIGGPNVGKFFRVQPGGAVYGVYEEKQKGWWGSPMTTNCEQFTNTGDGFGFYMEIPAFGPGFVASVIPWISGRQHKEMMTKVPYISTFIWFLRDKGHGQITIDETGNSTPVYQLSDETDQKNFHHAAAEAVRIHEAAGAQEILVSLAHQQLIWKRGQNLENYIRTVQKQPIINGNQPMISAHQLCSCRMGKDPAISVADTDGQLRDVKGVWIGDGSACPTSLGANPMITIMALAQRTAGKMLADSRTSSVAAGYVVSSRQEVNRMQTNQNQSSYTTGESRIKSGPNALQFAHLLELETRPGRARRVIQILRDHAIPTIIQPAEGFIDEIVLFSLDVPDHVTAISFWQNEEVSDRFDSYGFDQVSELLKDVLTQTATRHPYTIGASTNPRIRGWVRIPTSARSNGRAPASATNQPNVMPGRGSPGMGLPGMGSSPAGLGSITGMANNMLRGMLSLMNPTTMFREMTGLMTNPLNVFSMGQRMLMGGLTQPMQPSGGRTPPRTGSGSPLPSRAPVSRTGVAPILQFAHIIELETKPGRGKEAIDIIGEQAIPTILQPAEGFIDGIVMASLSDPSRITSISFWDNQEVSDRFDGYGFDQVSQLLKDVMAAAPRRRAYNVGCSTNPRILGWSQ